VPDEAGKDFATSAPKGSVRIGGLNTKPTVDLLAEPENASGFAGATQTTQETQKQTRNLSQPKSS